MYEFLPTRVSTAESEYTNTFNLAPYGTIAIPAAFHGC